MRNYRELLLVSRKAFVYEVFFNQILTHSILGLGLVAYSFLLRGFYDNGKRKTVYNFVKDIAGDFIRLRAFFAVMTLLT